MLKAGWGFRKPLSLGRYGCCDCAEDVSLAVLLGEYHDTHSSEVCVAWRFEAERKGLRAEVFQTADSLQVSDDSGVLQTAAAVFSAANFCCV